MKNIRRIPFFISGFIVCMDFVAMCLALVSAKFLFFIAHQQFPEFAENFLTEPKSFSTLYYLFFSIWVIGNFSLKGHYTNRVPWFSQVGMVFRTFAGLGLLDLFIQYNLNESAFPEPQAIFWTISFLFLISIRMGSLYIVQFAKPWFLPAIIVGNAPTILDVLHSINSDGHTGYKIDYILLLNPTGRPLDPDSIPTNFKSVPVISDVDDCLEFMKNNKAYLYFLDMGEIAKTRNQKIYEYVNSTEGHWSYLPNVKFLNVYGMDPHYFFGNDLMILHQREKINMPIGRLLKRAIDVIGSSFALPLLLILTIIVWVSKKINKSDTPIFYGGERLGKNGQVFKCWKFCTMRKDADEILASLLESDEGLKKEWDTFNKLKKDPRIDTKISAILRKSSLDEIPQLWNVFVGEMSLVGPRPILENQREMYGNKIHRYFSVTPGLTGLWQVSGRNETTFEKRVYWDNWYITNWTLWNDIVILFKTVKVFMSGAGAY